MKNRPRPTNPIRRARAARLVALIFTLVQSATTLVQASDWPTYRADFSRSGVSPDPLPARISEAWNWNSRHRPQPAWQGEAKWDGWNKVYQLKARQTFDRSFQPVIAGNRVLFGSSADDKIYCLDAGTGRELWSFCTEGPVRFAPSVQDGRAYVGSDDGHVYCLDADTGRVLWKKLAGPEDRRIPGNGRVISAWPVRTSVVVQNNTVYTTAGMFPSEGVHLVALDAATGAEKWRQIQKDLPAQGYLLASSTRLYVPAGRDNPVICDITNGKRLQVVEGAGGTYALLTGDMLVFGPGKTGQLGAVEDGRRDQLATFQGNHMIVTPTRSFLHSDTELSALDRAKYLDLAREKKSLSAQQGRIGKQLKELAKKKDTDAAQQKLKDELTAIGTRLDDLTTGMQNCVLWKKTSQWPLSVILAGQTLVVGGENEVAAFDSEKGTLQWKQTVRGNAYGLAAANGMLVISTDEGAIHCLQKSREQASLVPTAPRKEVLP